MKNHIRRLRLQHGWTQDFLARSVGVSRQSLSAFENLRCNPSLERALRLARVLDTTIARLFAPGRGRGRAGSRS